MVLIFSYPIRYRSDSFFPVSVPNVEAVHHTKMQKGCDNAEAGSFDGATRRVAEGKTVQTDV